MSDQVAIRGGFGVSLRSQMSEGLQRRIAAEEAAEQRQMAAEQRERTQRAEAWQQNAITAAIQDALARGEEFSPKMLAGRGLGSTHSEFIQQRAALMDVEDAQIQARQAVAYRKWLQEQSDGMSGDTSAHTVLAERAEEAEQREKRDRDLVRRGRQIDRARIIRSARQLAAQDRREDRLLGR
jgi:hypothetical protein